MTERKRTYSRYAQEGLGLFGKSIRLGRMERRLTAQELAERIGVSRSTLQRIEKGDPKVEIGLMFEAASIVGVKLFDADEKSIISLAGRDFACSGGAALRPGRNRHLQLRPQLSRAARSDSALSPRTAAKGR